MRPHDVLKAVRVQAAFDALDVSDVSDDTIRVRARRGDATIRVETRAAGTVVIIRLNGPRVAALGDAIFRLTRQATARGEARAVQENRVGVEAFDRAWAIETVWARDEELLALEPALSPLAAFDTMVDATKSDLTIEVRSGTGLDVITEANVAGVASAMLSLWLHLSGAKKLRPDHERHVQREATLAARLAEVEADFTRTVELYAGAPARVGDALEAHLTLPIAGQELTALVRLRVARGEAWDLLVEGQVGGGAPTVVLQKWPVLIGASTPRIDAPEELRSAGAIEALCGAARVDAAIAPGRIKVDATLSRADLSRVVGGALELWRLARGG